MKMHTFIDFWGLSPSRLSPALDGRPEAGLSLNELNQLVSELEIVAKRETLPIHGINTKEYSGEKVREIKVFKELAAGGFQYGIRDYILMDEGRVSNFGISIQDNKHLKTRPIAVGEGSCTSLSIWEDWVPRKFVAELYSYER